jgi:hypothetical protein
LISMQRGRRSTRRKPEALRRALLAIIREWYCGFGPTLAAKKLREVHGIALGGRDIAALNDRSRSVARSQAAAQARYQPRRRRDCVGALVQVDGCEHWWCEDRDPQCTLLAFIDDATGCLMHLQFVKSESTFGYFHATRCYLEAWGQPIAFHMTSMALTRQSSQYSDRRLDDPVRVRTALPDHGYHLRPFELDRETG